MRTVAVLLVGDEILAGEVQDENGPFLLQRLATAGAPVVRVAVCPDREDDVVLELLRLRALADAVLVCGGIGPTHDDVTRQALARALGVPLTRHPEAEQRLRGFYGQGITPSDLDMALLPQGARLVLGPTTGTYGFALAGVYGLPGVPFLVCDLVEAILLDLDGAPLHRVELRTDLREGEIAPVLTAAQRDAGEMAIGSYPVCLDGRWLVRVVIRGPDPERVRALELRLRADLGRLVRPPPRPTPGSRSES